jgi:hypothetical protein
MVVAVPGRHMWSRFHGPLCALAGASPQVQLVSTFAIPTRLWTAQSYWPTNDREQPLPSIDFLDDDQDIVDVALRWCRF